MKRTSRSLIFATFCLVAGATRAQGQATPPAAPSLGDPVARSLFEPELIMKHRRAIDLTDQQRDAISKLIRELQGRVVSMQWDLQDQVEALGAELNRPRVDLDRAQDRMSRVLQTEREIKAAHLTLLIRIKNQLTPAQQESLRKLRSEPGAGSDADATVGDRPAPL